mgnify:CR=1 FL=1
MHRSVTALHATVRKCAYVHARSQSNTHIHTQIKVWKLVKAHACSRNGRGVRWVCRSMPRSCVSYHLYVDGSESGVASNCRLCVRVRASTLLTDRECMTPQAMQQRAQ